MQRTYLREWRIFRGYTLEHVAAELDMTHQNLGRIERALVPYQQTHMEKLANVYECDVTDFFLINPLDPEQGTVVPKNIIVSESALEEILEAVLNDGRTSRYTRDEIRTIVADVRAISMKIAGDSVLRMRESLRLYLGGYIDKKLSRPRVEAATS